ncbi:UDP-N-acetylglucosamine 2-epimerase (non-hydrolyzing) [candidate division WOR-3 bacterium]|nr:UDP-N-acetylglucosamine 2-epimerase (non-hydrolyzing) [candidate division WOR-3 bacterium]
MKKTKIILAVGARPNYMKAAPVYFELKKYKKFQPLLVHTGQHYDAGLSKVFFDDLKLPRPDIHLGLGSGTHAVQTGKIMVAFEKVCLKEKPDLVVVVGDVNSTIACALVAAKLWIQVAHVEAGLRSFDRTMPEEINRLLTDQISDYLFTTCVDADENLLREGIDKRKIFFVGNTMIDSLNKHLKAARAARAWEKLGLGNGPYALMTLHRPSNVDDRKTLQRVFDGVNPVAQGLPVVFPVHPRTLKQLDGITWTRYDRKAGKGILNLAPLGYLGFLGLMERASRVLTDSGGIQEETTILGEPCLTLRDNTERPITVEQGTNMLVGNDPDRIVRVARRQLRMGKRRKCTPKYWDGRAAIRIAKILNLQFRR